MALNKGIFPQKFGKKQADFQVAKWTATHQAAFCQNKEVGCLPR